MKINQLYERYSKHLFFTSLRITGNSALAEEAVQDAFIKYHVIVEFLCGLGGVRRGVGIAVSLWLLVGLVYEEIAQITGVEQKSIRSNYMRGKERIAQYLKSHKERV